MKKALNTILSALLVSVCLVLTAAAAELRLGSIIDYTYATDIRAFFDGAELAVHNVGGKLGIVAEDLRPLGFTVTWNGENRTLSISRGENAKTTPSVLENPKKYRAGRRLKPVLHTDIVTYLEGSEVQSFNIDGYTVIYFTELAIYGECVYDEGAALSTITTGGSLPEKVTLEALPKEILHAGGAVGYLMGSNSLEALNMSYGAGYRVFELDFVMSSDGVPVSLHHWSVEYSSALTGEPITAEEFADIKIYDVLTSITLPRLARWMAAHPDAYIVTDVKDDNLAVLGKIATDFPEIMPNIIPQIYTYDEFAPVRACGYSNVVLTLYGITDYNIKTDSEALAEFAKSRGLLAVAGAAALLPQNPGYEKAFASADVPLFVYTVNDSAEKQALFEMGVSCVYTDRGTEM